MAGGERQRPWCYVNDDCVHAAGGSFGKRHAECEHVAAPPPPPASLLSFLGRRLEGSGWKGAAAEQVSLREQKTPT